MKCRQNDPEFEKMFRTPGGKPCSRLAVLYHWAQPETDRRAQVINFSDFVCNACFVTKEKF